MTDLYGAVMGSRMANALSLVGKESIIRFNKWMQLKFDYEWQKVFPHAVWSVKLRGPQM